MRAGYLPPLAAGFQRVLESPDISRKLEEAIEHEYREGKPDPYDTHPPLRERLTALAVTPDGPALGAGERALGLLDGLSALERGLGETWVESVAADPELRAALKPRPGAASLTAVSWDDVGMQVAVPSWQAFIKQFASHLDGVTPGELPTLEWKQLGWRLTSGGEDDLVHGAADWVVGTAVGLALVRAGYVVHSRPGERQTLVRGDDRVDVFALRERLARGPDEVEQWRALCERAGIATVDLGAVAKGA
jgi:hypothetical protein